MPFFNKVSRLIEEDPALLHIIKKPTARSLISVIKIVPPSWLDLENYDRDPICPGELAGLHRLNAFLEEGVKDYQNQRDFSGMDGTSRLSPYLAIGHIIINYQYDLVRIR